MENTKRVFVLRADIRQDEKPAFLRQQGKVPAILYGKEVKPLKLALDKKEFLSIFKGAGESSLVSLKVPGDEEARLILFKEPQLNPITGEIIHCDLYQIKAGEKLHTEIPLEFVGEPPAVKERGGVLLTNKTELEIECLPRDLPSEIEVDLSNLKNIEDRITVEQLKLPKGIRVLDSPEEVVVVISPPREEEVEEKEVAEEEEVAAVKVEGESKEEGAAEEAKEGEPDEESAERTKEKEK